MDSQARHRSVSRQRPKVSQVRAPVGSRQICLDIDQSTYDDIWDDSAKVRAVVEEQVREHPELFPPDFGEGFFLTGTLPASKKMPGIRLRQVQAGTVKYTLRPSFVMPYFCGMVEDVEKPLLLLSFGVPCWLVTRVFGRNDMFWHRHLERLGRNSLVETTVFTPADLPEHLAADEHHADWQGKKGYIATTAAQGCLLGVALTDEADQTHLEEAYGVFAREAREFSPDYAPKTVNTDGWFPTSNTFKALFPKIVSILCFLHGFLKVRDRARKAHDLHTRIWEIYRATNIRMFDRRMSSFRKWFEAQENWPSAVQEMVAKIWKRAKQYRVAFRHPECYRTSNQVDRPMNRMTRLLYAGRGLHGNLVTSENRLRGWALVFNFREFAHRAGSPRKYRSPAERLNQRRYHDNWLKNLLISASLAGRKSTPRKR